jgi:2-dehydro-3-deoxyphosphooctonate aldolase (KDO 8-P synthase)
MNEISVNRDLLIGQNGRLAVIAGPCVIESKELCRTIAREVLEICTELGLPYIFKASFDKANRTSALSFRGEGLDHGLNVLAQIKEEFGVPVLTDVHEPSQCEVVAQVADVLQIPAFLSRQTDLLTAAAETGRVLNIKKGQFLAPWDAKNIIDKVVAAGSHKIMLCERGVSFGYNTLVVDMRSLPILRSFGYPVVFDGTHSVQQPGGQGTSSGGQREFIPHLVRAAVATGCVDALFLEVHPEPEKALSDSATMLPMSELKSLLTTACEIQRIVRSSVGGSV